MCGRYFFVSSPVETAAHFGVDVRDNFPPRYNIAPTQPVALIRHGQDRGPGRGGREYALARWGFIPGWARKVEGRPIINARAETAAEKPSFRSAFRRRRCLVPANGYYEWVGKRVFCVRRPDEALFAFAGLWETLCDPDGGEIDTLAILTGAAGPDMAGLHARAPLVIPQADYASWLETDERDIAALARLLAPAPAGSWRAYEVSPAVGPVRNEGAALIEPLERQGVLV